MIDDKGILIKNIFYMLTYAFQVLKQDNYKNIMSEQFDNIQNLFAKILSKGISKQLKQGLYREYITFEENLSVVKGKINITKTINNKIQDKQKVFCEHDELSENNIFNQILKTACYYLIKDKTVKKEYKDELKQILMFFSNVDIVNHKTIKWKRLVFQKNNQSYKMLMYICYFLFDCLIPTTEEGKYMFRQFSEENMARLYEKFVLEYYKKHYKGLLHVNSSQIDWVLSSSDNREYLPKMQSDISIWDNNGNTLIIDTKYYAHTMISSLYDDKKILHNHNLYQIFTYVKNKDVSNSGKVSGILLYAKTNEVIVPDEKYVMSGNKIQVKTLDLNKEFKEISNQLDQIICDYFGNKLLAKLRF